MAIVKGKEALNSVRARKKFSTPNGYGQAQYGVSEYGFFNALAGIYQQRKGKKHKINVRMKFYEPVNPQTVPQQANRIKFANAVIGWQNLTTEQKEVYNQRASKMNIYGYNLYVKEFMNN